MREVERLKSSIDPKLFGEVAFESASSFISAFSALERAATSAADSRSLDEVGLDGEPAKSGLKAGISENWCNLTLSAVDVGTGTAWVPIEFEVRAEAEDRARLLGPSFPSTLSWSRGL